MKGPVVIKILLLNKLFSENAAGADLVMGTNEIGNNGTPFFFCLEAFRALMLTSLRRPLCMITKHTKKEVRPECTSPQSHR